MSNNYLHAINWFRGVAILFVVLIHAPSNVLLTSDVGTYIYAYFKNGTSFFVFISGYLFWHLKDKFEYKNYLKSKTKNVVSPYLIVISLSVFGIYSLSLLGINSIDYSKFDYQVNFIDVLNKNGIVWHYLKGNGINYPLWFIPMMIVFFILSPLIYSIAGSRFFYLFLIVALSYTFTTERGHSAEEHFLHFLGVYLFGICCKKNQDFIWKNSRKIIFVAFTLSLLFLYFKLNFKEHFLNFTEIEKIFSIVFYLSLFMLLEKKQVKLKLFDVLAKYSFGIFFIHYYFLIVCTIIFQSLGLEDTMYEFVFTYLITLILSLIVCKFVKKQFPKKSRLLFGI
jgi:peptidoglycan/LPS O-acetylase OafA/YrhL